MFNEVKRVLRDDGTLWLNLGDSFAGSHGWKQTIQEKNPGTGGGENKDLRKVAQRNDEGYKPKDLMGVPWAVAFALQNAGWYLRADIIWQKGACMPESVEDRPVRAHEYIFLLSKSPKYYYDHIAVREEASTSSLKRISKKTFDSQKGGPKDYANGINPSRSARKALENFAQNPGRNQRDVWLINPGSGHWEYCKKCDTLFDHKERSQIEKSEVDGEQVRKCICGAIDGWVDHFAVFPIELPIRCIMAGTSEHGCCSKCGAPYKRISKRVGGAPTSMAEREDLGLDRKPSTFGAPVDETETGLRGQRSWRPPAGAGTHTIETVDWQATCSCNAEVVPCTVLDPFSGSGTSGIAAVSLGRDYVGCELSQDYAQASLARIKRAKQEVLKEGAVA